MGTRRKGRAVGGQRPCTLHTQPAPAGFQHAHPPFGLPCRFHSFQAQGGRRPQRSGCRQHRLTQYSAAQHKSPPRPAPGRQRRPQAERRGLVAVVHQVEAAQGGEVLQAHACGQGGRQLTHEGAGHQSGPQAAQGGEAGVGHACVRAKQRGTLLCSCRAGAAWAAMPPISQDMPESSAGWCGMPCAARSAPLAYSSRQQCRPPTPPPPPARPPAHPLCPSR